MLDMLGYPPKLRSPRTLVFSKGCRLVQEHPWSMTSPQDAVDHLRDQNAGLGDRLTELTYGPQRTQNEEIFEPKWVKMDSKVLCFGGVLSEEEVEEGGAVRHVKVKYFLEDDTMKVTEKPTPNSGLWQGTVVCRGRYLHPSGTRDYGWKDLNNGRDLVVHGRRVHLTHCDPWTKQFLTDAGTEVRPPEPRPQDPRADEARRNMGRRPQSRHKEGNGAMFFRDAGKVLRFYGIWKDYDRQPKAVRRITLKYYLSDGSLQVVENPPPNGGWSPLLPFDASVTDLATGSSCTLVKRQKVMRDRQTDTAQLPCYLEPSDLDGVSWLGPEDLRTGQDITILGKTLFLAKCDAYTEHYYREELGLEMAQVEIMQKPKTLPIKVFPRHGIGRVEETLQDCFRPIDRPPKRIHRPIVPKPPEIANAVLRFAAIMDTPRPSEQDRTFILSFYPEDDTVKITESQARPGGGTFLRRGRLPKGDYNCHYEIGDFYIGAKIAAKGEEFVLMDADEFVLAFMERHPEIYPALKRLNSSTSCGLACYTITDAPLIRKEPFRIWNPVPPVET